MSLILDTSVETTVLSSWCFCVHSWNRQSYAFRRVRKRSFPLLPLPSEGRKVTYLLVKSKQTGVILPPSPFCWTLPVWKLLLCSFIWRAHGGKFSPAPTDYLEASFSLLPISWLSGYEDVTLQIVFVQLSGSP